MTRGSSGRPEPEFDRLLARAYRGELSGETMFAVLADRCDDAGRAASLQTLADLERRMGLAIAPLLRRYGVDGGDDAQSRRKGHDRAVAIGELAWDAFLAQFEPVTDAALARYHQLRSIAPDPDPVLDELVAHEEALQAFAAAELRGESGDALELVRAVIARLSASSDRSPADGAAAPTSRRAPLT